MKNTSLREYQDRIYTLARSKDWSDDLHWLQLGIFKEVGELIQDMEHYQDSEVEMRKEGASQSYINAVLATGRTGIAKEFGDVIFFLFQSMHHFDIDLDEALEMVIQDNTMKKKKTINAKGEIVRK